MKRILVVLGTRPEAVKLAPVVRALHRSTTLTPVVVVSGQHRGLLDQTMAVLGLEPEHDLRILRAGQTPNSIVAAVLDRLPAVLRLVGPDAMLVHGDTSTAFAAALAAFHHQVPSVHLEAGLRTHDPATPFPEETNRRLIARLARLHLAPTPGCAANLTAEGVDGADIAVTGNTVIDILQEMRGLATHFLDPELASWIAGPEPIVVVTMHRRESWGRPMRMVAEAIARLAREWPAVRFVLPLHVNPVIRASFTPALAGLPNVLISMPVGYLEMIALLDRARLVLTDSGGIQEEAPSVGTPVLVLRDHTERVEALEVGAARLVGCDPDRVVATVRWLLRDEAAYRRMARARNPFGDGRATGRVIAAIDHLFGVGERSPDFDPVSDDAEWIARAMIGAGASSAPTGPARPVPTTAPDRSTRA